MFEKETQRLGRRSDFYKKSPQALINLRRRGRGDRIGVHFGYALCPDGSTTKNL